MNKCGEIFGKGRNSNGRESERYVGGLCIVCDEEEKMMIR